MSSSTDLWGGVPTAEASSRISASPVGSGILRKATVFSMTETGRGWFHLTVVLEP